MLHLLLPSLLLWAADRWLRFRSFQRNAFPVTRLVALGGGATRVEVDHGGRFAHRPGQWCYLAFRFADGMREQELHPFSICCAPGSGKAVFVVKAVGGPDSFSRRLRRLAERTPPPPQQAADGGGYADFSEMPEAHLDGPYGCLAVRLGATSGSLIRSVFLVAGGSGITPLAAVAEGLLGGGRAARVHLLWVCREREAFAEWIPEALSVRTRRLFRDAHVAARTRLVTDEPLVRAAVVLCSAADGAESALRGNAPLHWSAGPGG